MGTPRIEASRISAVWARATALPLRRIADAICIRQPGLAVTRTSAPVATTAAALRRS